MVKSQSKAKSVSNDLSTGESSQQNGDKTDLVEAAYRTAIDPTLFDELRMTWERMFYNNDELQLKETDGLQKLTSHFDRAESILDKIGAVAEEQEGGELHHLIERFHSVVAIIFNERSEVAAVNEAGKTLFKVDVGDTVSDVDVTPEFIQPIQHALAICLKEEKPETRILKVGRSTPHGSIVLQLRGVTTSSNTRHVTVITADTRWPAQLDQFLKTTFELSISETDIVRGLVEHGNIKQVAQHRGRSIETVRTQVKAIMVKMEVNSQVELVRNVMTLMDFTTEANLDRDKTGKEPSEYSVGLRDLKTIPYQTIYDPDGRRIDYLVLGDPKGKPALYLSTELGITRWPACAEQEAEKRGIKIISPVRAGFGHSDPIPKGGKFGVEVARDCLRILDHENIEHLPVISVAADILFAVEMDILQPGSVSALIATSGAYPFLNDAQAARQHPWHRFMHSGARYTPTLIPFIVKAAFGLAGRAGLENMAKQTFKTSPADLVTFSRPDVEEAVKVGALTTLSKQFSAHKAFSQQILSYHNPNHITKLHAMKDRFPIISLNGTSDPSMPAKTLEENQKEWDWIDFRIYEGAGQWLLFEHYKDVLDLVASVER